MKTRVFRTGLLTAALLFTGVSLWFVLREGRTGDLLIVPVTAVLLLLPKAAEKLFGWQFGTGFYVLLLLYALGPMLGDVYRLYYTTLWWDKLLHTTGGVVFALLAFYLFRHWLGTSAKPLACALFALCCSMAVAAAWEFVEFGVDSLCGTDMQHDTVVSAIHSYALGGAPGELGHVPVIDEVTVNGVSLPLAGYLDIGLVDSMADMLWESAGALAAALFCWRYRGRALLSFREPQTVTYTVTEPHAVC